jgi:hypothetical protein
VSDVTAVAWSGYVEVDADPFELHEIEVRAFPWAGYVEVDGFATTARTATLERRVRVCDVNGEGFADLEAATVGTITFALNAPTTFTFELDVTDDKAAVVLDERFREAQIWAGDWLVTQGPIISVASSDGRLTCTCADALWYLGRRLIGGPLTNRLTNPRFEAGLTGWSTGRFAGFSLLPTDTVNRVEVRPLAARIWRLGDLPLIWQDITVTAGPLGLTVTAEAEALITATDYNADADDALLLARYPADYRTRNYPGTGAPLPPGGFGNMLWAHTAVPNPPEAVRTSTIDPKHPLGIRVRHTATIEIPPGATETVHFRLTGRRGQFGHLYTTEWSNAALWIDEAFEVADENLADTLGRLVEHAQDPALGRSDLNLDAVNAPAAGTGAVTAARRWPYLARTSILEAIDALAGEGRLDYWLEVTATGRNLAFTSPRRARQTGLELDSARNLASWSWAYDGATAATDVDVAGPTEVGYRQGHASNPAGYADGLTLEAVVTAPTGTAAADLDAYAAAHLEAVHDPETVSVTTRPDARDLVGHLWPGDVVGLRIDDGALQVTGTYRAVKVSLAPDDSLAIELNRETPAGVVPGPLVT